MDAGGNKLGAGFSLQRLLARGRHSDVYAALHAETRDPVVVRALRASACADETGRKAVATWGRAAMALSHPSLVPVVGVARVEGLPHVVFEARPGLDLQTVCIADAPLIPQEVAAVAIAVLRVMAFLHTRRAPDGGVWTLGKQLPSGVRLTRDGDVLVLDPGIAHNALSTQRSDARILEDLRVAGAWVARHWRAPPDPVFLWIARTQSEDPAARFVDGGDAAAALGSALERSDVRPAREVLAELVARLNPARPATQELLPDDPARIAGTRYRVGARLGAGGMGEVFEAHHLDLGRDVALKILYPSQLDDGPSVRRFRDEARMIANLSHPNLVHVTDFGVTEDGRLFYAMERLTGETLRSVLRAKGRLPLAQVVSVATQVCAGLDEAHRKGVIHRDVKPENIFVCSDGRIVLLDFGIAKARRPAALGIDPGPITAVGEVYGTPGYISPEQACGLAVDARSDVYALGAVLYECLAGVPPFPRGTIRQLAPPRPIAVRAPDARVPPALDALVVRCLAVEPKDRPSSASDVASALQGALRRRGQRIGVAAMALMVVASIAWLVLRALH